MCVIGVSAEEALHRGVGALWRTPPCHFRLLNYSTSLSSKNMLIPLNSLQKRSSLICSRNIKHTFKYYLCGNTLNICSLIGLIYTSVSCNCCLSAAFLANFGNFGEFFMTKMQSDDLRRRGGYPADPQRSREKLFFFFSSLDPQIRGSRILPELVCDVTKRRITAKVMWASVILRFTFHLIWVSMTARSIHHKWIHFSFLFLQPGANSLNLQKTSALDNVKSQKVPEKEKRGGRGDLSVFLKQP